MYLKSLSLQNFRNCSKKTFGFSPDTTLILGPNASGKTNILEAIYLLSRGRSFRAKRELEMISYDGELARVEGEVGGKLEIILTTGQVQSKSVAKKLFKVNGVGKRMMDYIGNFKSVLFRPEDIDIVLGSPSIRRNYLDSILDLVDREYRVCNVVYKKGLRQRNKLLEGIRQGWAKKPQLEYWNRLVIKNGQIVSRKREELIEFFNSQFVIFKNKKDFGGLVVEYDESPISIERLAKYAEAEVGAGVTLVGPHRDDMKFTVPSSALGASHRLIQPRLPRDASAGRQSSQFTVNRDLNLFGSRGEQRMAVLGLKLAELKYIEQQTEQTPLLLLDDIFSELDEKHRLQVINLVKSRQSIISSVDLNFEGRDLLGKIKVIHL